MLGKKNWFEYFFLSSKHKSLYSYRGNRARFTLSHNNKTNVWDVVENEYVVQSESCCRTNPLSFLFLTATQWAPICSHVNDSNFQLVVMTCTWAKVCEPQPWYTDSLWKPIVLPRNLRSQVQYFLYEAFQGYKNAF